MLLGLVLSAAIGLVAYRRESLSASGVVGAMVVGTLIFGFGGWVWGLLLIAFFVLSSLLSHYRQAEKRDLAEKFAKGGRRDWAQALANGSLGAILALTYFLRPSPILFVAFVGAMAAVTADTWGTELGVLSPTYPRLITNWEQVEPGTSGGISTMGTVASTVGALLIGVLALLLDLVGGAIATGSVMGYQRGLPALALAAGLAGSLFDSWLGATVQAMFYCPNCGKETEKTLHGCGRSTIHVRGWLWLQNDLVNFASSAVGAGVAAGLYTLFNL
ncbi:MAG: DUF92 domain-containing protein [Anaerolineae bacterium]